MADKYRVIDYFDVWGNQEDGYGVNNLATVGEIEVQDYTDTRELVQAMVDMGFLIDEALRVKFDVMNDYYFIEFFLAHNSRPFCRLELIEGESAEG